MDNKPLITIVDEPEHIEIDMGEMAVITNQDHASLKNLDYANSGHTGFASQADVEMLIGKIEGKSQSFTVNTLAELGNLFNLTITEAADSYIVTTSHIIYKGKEYSLYNGNEFYIIQENVPDFWFSLDNMKLYKMETKLDASGGIKQLIGTEEKPINFATDMEVGHLYSCSGYVFRTSGVNTSLPNDILVYKMTAGSAKVFGIGFMEKTNNANSPESTSYVVFDKDTGVFNNSTKTYVRFERLNGSIHDTSIYAPKTAGTAGQILQSNGSGAPIWVTPNFATLDDINNAINGMWEESY